jgi:hypothetical protein
MVLIGERTAVHRLGGEPFLEPLEPYFGKGRQILLPAKLLHRPSDQALGGSGRRHRRTAIGATSAYDFHGQKSARWHKMTIRRAMYGRKM